MFHRAVITGLMLVSSLTSGQVLNGGFEIPDPNSPLDFIAPLHWDRIPHPDSIHQDDCFAGLYDSFTPAGVSWEISHSFQGDNFVLLHTGSFDRIDDSSVAGSIISQEVFLSPGNTIIGAYFFGTTDYLNFNDSASISLHMSGDPNNYPGSVTYFVIPESHCDVSIVGNYNSTLSLSPETDGWIFFSHVVQENQTGPYYLRCQVADYGDKIYPSYYAIDNLQVCTGGLSAADLNLDCDVNLEDYSIVSNAWMSFCPDIYDPNTMDPNDFAPPEIPCQLADIDNSWYVDANDLSIMSENWID